MNQGLFHSFRSLRLVTVDMISRVACVCVIAMSAFLPPLARATPLEESFDLLVPAAPMARPVDDGQELVYELHLSNFTRRDLQPRRVDVLDAADGRVLASYEGQALEQRLDRSGLQWRADTYQAIPSGRRGVVFIELTMPGALPQMLRHRIAYSDATNDAGLRYVEGGSASVLAGNTPVLAPPLRGGPWVAIYGARWERGHRRVGYATEGMLRTPGRYAVDWVKLDSSARKAPAGNTLAARAFSHGEDVLAVAHGVVVSVDDHWPERTRLSDRPTDLKGNSVVLALGNGYFAHYGHLKPGSVLVAPGARVRAGDKIAQVGFSGSASSPQLHFALTDGPVELASEGVAYAFDRYRLLGGFSDVSQIGVSGWTRAPDKTARGLMPAALSVLRWSE
jgi:murein DD-endopeptidase